MIALGACPILEPGHIAVEGITPIRPGSKGVCSCLFMVSVSGNRHLDVIPGYVLSPIQICHRRTLGIVDESDEANCVEPRYCIQVVNFIKKRECLTNIRTVCF